jgi:flagellar FliJ protein
MTAASQDDRSLTAVRRVRAARERDSRIGLQHALLTRLQRRAEADAARARLVQAPVFDRGDLRTFRGHRALVAGIATAYAESEQRAQSSDTVAAEAQRRWQQDQTAVRAVELLLERRAEERRLEQQRRETRDLDDLAGQAWLRRRTQERGA